MNENKAKILELMWSNENHAEFGQIAKGTEIKPRALNMHLRGLIKDGHVEKLKWHEYALTPKGREALGFPKTDGQLAQKVLRKTPQEWAFIFYRGIDQPAGVTSDSLEDFCEKLGAVDAAIVEFHVGRGDFEAWVVALGDAELAKRLKGIREAKLAGEPLRKKVHETVKFRHAELLNAK
jgi:DNA-binding HxlR family transcriptional regulator